MVSKIYSGHDSKGRGQCGRSGDSIQIKFYSTSTQLAGRPVTQPDTMGESNTKVKQSKVIVKWQFKLSNLALSWS